jgi:hypothetical protein
MPHNLFPVTVTAAERGEWHMATDDAVSAAGGRAVELPDEIDVPRCGPKATCYLRCYLQGGTTEVRMEAGLKDSPGVPPLVLVFKGEANKEVFRTFDLEPGQHTFYVKAIRANAKIHVNQCWGKILNGATDTSPEIYLAELTCAANSAYVEVYAEYVVYSLPS